jgi:membrane peptidoglycan carboxypeptidase
MENVHGISVSGGSFPAEIWRRFMEPALAGRPARDFPEPRHPVSFRTWERGPLALSYDPYYTPPTPAEPEKAEDDADTGGDNDKPSAGAGAARKPASGAATTDDPGNVDGPPSSPARPLDP